MAPTKIGPYYRKNRGSAASRRPNKIFQKITLIINLKQKNHAKILNFEIKIWGKVLKILERIVEKFWFLEEICKVHFK